MSRAKRFQIIQIQASAIIYDNPTAYNDIKIKTAPPNTISIQQVQIEKIQPVDNQKVHVGALIQLVSPCMAPTSDVEPKLLQKAKEYLHQTKLNGLNLVPLNLYNFRIVLLSDPSSVNAKWLDS